MSDYAAIEGSFSECRMVKTRSAFQLVIEVPIESADHALNVLGGMPQPGRERPVVVARLARPIIEQPKPDHGHKLATRMGIKCTEPTFRRFLWERGYIEGEMIPTEEDATKSVRAICGVDSRANIDGNPEAETKCRALIGEYEEWNAL